MTLNSRRSSWTTRWPKDRPPCSTSHPQVEGVLCSSSCLLAHHSRNCHVLRWPLPLLPLTPTTATKARVRAREKGKARTTAPSALTTIAGAPQRGPSSTILGPTSSRCEQGCVLRSSSQHVHRITPCSLHRCTTGLPMVPPSHPYRRLHRTSSRSRPLVTLDRHAGSTMIGQLLQHHGLDYPGGHRLGRRLQRLQQHHIGWR
jgi:hypothetical protein